MIRRFKFFILIKQVLATLLIVNISFAGSFADSVISVEYGYGAGFGQAFFPENILGPPDSTATSIVPSASPQELLSLGRSGSIVLFFSSGINNGPGADFTIFENVFYVNGTEDNAFIEAGIVEASFDGISWFLFPYNSDNYSGLAGVTPTNGEADPFDPALSGGDSFDLEDINLEFAHYLRITDADTLVEDDGDSFDLDAVAVINSGMESSSSISTALIKEFSIKTWPNPFNSTLNISIDSAVSGKYRLDIFDILGRSIANFELYGNQISWNALNLPSGYYVLRVTSDFEVIAVQKVLLSK